MRNMPDIPDILKQMSQACPVVNKVSIELDGNDQSIVSFCWSFKIEKQQYVHCFTVPFIDLYKPLLIKIVQVGIVMLKRKIESISKNHHVDWRFIT